MTTTALTVTTFRHLSNQSVEADRNTRPANMVQPPTTIALAMCCAATSLRECKDPQSMTTILIQYHAVPAMARVVARRDRGVLGFRPIRTAAKNHTQCQNEVEEPESKPGLIVQKERCITHPLETIGREEE